VRADRQAGLEAPKEKRSAVQDYLLERFADALQVTDEAIAEKFPKFKAESAELRKTIADTKKKLTPKPQIRALYEMGGEPCPAFLLRRGEAQMIGAPVEPGVPSVLNGLTDYKVTPPGIDSTGRRLALAKWLTQPNHPLTARVMVNRIWMPHFGRGIVASASFVDRQLKQFPVIAFST
jgi:hypothetical protein